MQLSIVSWVFFGLGVLIIVSVLALWTYTAMRAIISKPINDGLAILCFLGAVILLAVGLLVGLTSAGGMKAHDIQRDLTSQGYTVLDINTSANTAVVLIDNQPREVQVINNDLWKPYVSCPISLEGEILNQLIACRIVPSGDGI